MAKQKDNRYRRDVKAATRMILEDALEATLGNKTHAAIYLGIARSHLYKLLDSHGIAL